MLPAQPYLTSLTYETSLQFSMSFLITCELLLNLVTPVSYSFPADGILVKDLWPASYPLLADSSANTTVTDVVPYSMEEKGSWAHIGPKFGSSDPSRRYALYYVPTSKDTPRIQVSLRLQGFIHRHKIGALGNWRGCVS